MTLLPIVQEFKDKIYDEPLIRMNFNDHILLKQPLRKGQRLLGNSVDEAIQRVNLAITTPPSFENKEITGVPVYALFVDYLECPQGQNFFSNKTVNSYL